jgi:hypothetical protein
MNTIKPDDLQKIHLIPYAHHDHAWTNTRQWHIWRYLEGFCLSLDVMREHPDYTFLVDNVLHSLEILQRYCPSRIAEFRQRVGEGRIAVSNGGMALVRPSNSGDELYLRNIVTGRSELMDRLECAPILTFFNADTAVGHSQLPQILSLCGHRFYRSFRPEATLDHLQVPREMLWEGLDGSRIVHARGSYGGLMKGDCCDPDLPWSEARERFVVEELAQRLPLQQTRDLFLNIGCDDVMPLANLSDQPIDIFGFIERWNLHEPSHMEFSTPDRYLQAMDLSSLPVVKGVLDPCELSYNAPMRQKDSLWYHRFALDRMLTQLELIATLAESNGVPCDWSMIRSFWLQLMRISGHAMEFLLLEDYAEALDIARKTLIDVRQSMAALTDGLATATVRLAPVQHLLINPSQTDGEQVVPLHVTTARHIRGFRLLDPTGREVPYQITSIYTGDKNYVEKEYNEVDLVCSVSIPAFGMTSLALEFDGSRAVAKAALDMPSLSEGMGIDGSNPHVLDNGLLRMTIEDGVIVEVARCDVGTISRHDVDVGFGTVRFFHTTPTQDWTTRYDDISIDTFVCEKYSYPERGPLRWSIEQEGHIGNQPARLQMTLHRNDPTISFELSIVNSGIEGYYTVGFPGQAGSLEAGIPFGVELRQVADYLYSDDLKRSGEDSLSFERGCTGMFHARHFVGFLGVDRGYLALLQGDCGVYYRSKPAATSVELLLMKSFDSDVRTEKWVQKIGSSLKSQGEQTFHFGIAVLGKKPDGQQLHLLARRLVQPAVTAVRYSCEPGTVSPAYQVVSLSGGTLVLTACYREEDDMVIRMFEGSGKSGETQLQFRRPFYAARAVTLTGEPCDNCVVEVDAPKGSIRLAYQPWKILTIRLELQRGNGHG